MRKFLDSLVLALTVGIWTLLIASFSKHCMESRTLTPGDYCVATDGGDSNSGHYPNCWQAIR